MTDFLNQPTAMNLFTQHCQVVPVQGIITPRAVTATVARPTLHTLSESDRNRILDAQIEREKTARQHLLDAQSEAQTEGRVFPSRVNRHDD